MLIDFRKRRREWGGGRKISVREKHQLVASHMCLDQDWPPQPRPVTRNWTLHLPIYGMTLQPTEAHVPGLQSVLRTYAWVLSLTCDWLTAPQNLPVVPSHPSSHPPPLPHVSHWRDAEPVTGHRYCQCLCAFTPVILLPECPLHFVHLTNSYLSLKTWS